MERSEFKILQVSNVWHSPSGYGVESYLTLFDWLRRGFDVRQVAGFGMGGSMMGFADPKNPPKTIEEAKKQMLQVYPSLPGDNDGGPSAQLVLQTWKADVLVILYDIWMGAFSHLNPVTRLPEKPIHDFQIPWVMVDHDPIPEGTLLNGAVCYERACPTMFGTNQFKQNGISCRYIPFGQDHTLFKPVENEETKKELKTWVNTRTVPHSLKSQTAITEDSFLIFLNGANKDPYRKAFGRSFTGIQIFLEQNPDAWRDTRVYVHTWQKMTRDIPKLTKLLGVEGITRGTHDYHSLQGVPADKVAKFYQAADVFLHPTQGGGFEIPVLEAIMSGCPPITSDFVGLPELVPEGTGWLIPQKTKYWSSLDSLQFIADEYKIAEALADAYNHPEKVKKMGEKAREHAVANYTVKHMNDAWCELFDEIREAKSYKPLEQRKL